MRFICLLLVAAAACGRPPGNEDVRMIAVHRTPGKPMELFDPSKPAERIVAQREPEGYGLVVFVNVPRAGVKELQGRRAVLTSEEWRDLVDVVMGQGILGWKPAPVKRVVMDWGEAGLTVAAAKTHSPTWTAPLGNSGPPDALFKAMIKLAREKLPDVKLYYFK